MPAESVDLVFAALAHPVRRRVLDLLIERPGSTTAELRSHFKMSGVGLLKHVHVLEEAGLVVAEEHGRERWLYFNVVPIQAIYDRWTTDYARFWAGRLVDLKDRLESASRAVKRGAKSA